MVIRSSPVKTRSKVFKYTTADDRVSELTTTITTTCMMLFELFVFGVGGIVSSLAAVYLFKPQLFFIAYIIYARWSSGVIRKSARIGRVKWVYSERGYPTPGGSTIVLVHGFSAARDSWNWVIKNLPELVHIVAVDLPGHGETEDDPQEDMKRPYDYYVSNLNQFLNTIGLKDEKIHIVGLSMGGAIAGLYAAAYPQHVELLTMICPGMDTPVMSKMLLDKEKNKESPLLPETAEEQKKTMQYAMYKQMNFPLQFYKGMAELRKKYVPFFTKLMECFVLPENKGVLNRALDKITTPTHILWGEEDYIVHVSGAQVLKDGLSNVKQYDIIPECGHAMDMEKPKYVASRILHFRSNAY